MIVRLRMLCQAGDSLRACAGTRTTTCLAHAWARTVCLAELLAERGRTSKERMYGLLSLMCDIVLCAYLAVRLPTGDRSRRRSWSWHEWPE